METIPNSEVLKRVQAENPWWSTGKTADLHSDLQPREYLKLFTKLLYPKNEVRRAVVLMGPRRVGKTVLIHHAIQNLCDAGVDSKKICYLSVDNPIYTGKSLQQLLQLYQDATASKTVDGSYVIFDEIQYLKNWEVHLKTLVDSYPSVKFVASGSAAAALKLKSSESGAGRFTDFLLPPLTFHEYLKLLKREDLVTSGTTPAATDITKLNDEFVKYLNFGGYPEALFSAEIQANPARFIKSDIVDKVLLRDLPSLYGISDIQELNQLFTTLAYNTGREVSFEQLLKSSGVAKNTLKRYIEYLEAAFLIKIVHRIDQSARRFKRATTFKVYLTNPSIRAALFSPITPEDEAMGSLAETAIFAQWFHSDTVLHYARWEKMGGEVDLVSLAGSTQRPIWAVEVKWTDRFVERPAELTGLLAFCTANKLTRAHVTSKTKTAHVVQSGIELDFSPVSEYCYLLGHNLLRNKEIMQNLPQRYEAAQVEIPNPTEV